jgi:hypothetical protein
VVVTAEIIMAATITTNTATTTASARNNPNRSEAKKRVSSPGTLRQTTEGQGHKQSTLKPPRNTIHPIINEHPVVKGTGAAPDKKDQPTNSSAAGATMTPARPGNTITARKHTSCPCSTDQCRRLNTGTGG